jgi:hypothetical protein
VSGLLLLLLLHGLPGVLTHYPLLVLLLLLLLLTWLLRQGLGHLLLVTCVELQLLPPPRAPRAQGALLFQGRLALHPRVHPGLPRCCYCLLLRPLVCTHPLLLLQQPLLLAVVACCLCYPLEQGLAWTTAPQTGRLYH